MKGLTHQKKLDEVRARTFITMSNGRIQPFDGDAKATYMWALEELLPFVKAPKMERCMQVGKILSGYRSELVRYKLYKLLLKDSGVSKSTAHKYVRLWETYGNNLQDLLRLSMGKLDLIASHADDPVEYCRKHESMISNLSLDELRNRMDNLSASQKQENHREIQDKEATGANSFEESHMKSRLNNHSNNCEANRSEFSEQSDFGHDEQRKSKNKTSDHCFNSDLQRGRYKSTIRGHFSKLTYLSFVISILLAYMAGVTTAGNFIKNPAISLLDRLMVASEKGKAEEVIACLESGVDKDSQDALKMTPLMYACRSNRVKVVKVLLQRGADPNIRDNGGETALMFAALNGNCDIIRLLLEKGAEINLRTKDNWTALARAKQGQHWKIYQTLARAGGRP